MLDVPLARKVYEYLLANPDLHDQSVWLAQAPCGTVGCIAGTTMFLADQDVTYVPVTLFDNYELKRGYSAIALWASDVKNSDIEDAAACLLGLDKATAASLFECESEWHALCYLKELIDDAESSGVA